MCLGTILPGGLTVPESMGTGPREREEMDPETGSGWKAPGYHGEQGHRPVSVAERSPVGTGQVWTGGSWAESLFQGQIPALHCFVGERGAGERGPMSFQTIAWTFSGQCLTELLPGYPGRDCW